MVAGHRKIHCCRQQKWASQDAPWGVPWPSSQGIERLNFLERPVPTHASPNNL